MNIQLDWSDGQIESVSTGPLDGVTEQLYKITSLARKA